MCLISGGKFNRHGTCTERSRHGKDTELLRSSPVFHSVSVQCYYIAMQKRKVLVVGNWKMNPATLSEAKALFAKVKRAGASLRNVETALCPPFVFLSALSGVGVKLGSQDVFWQNGGRFTGEVSPEMLKNIGVSYCIVGHSERRALGETDEEVSKKASAALREGLKAVMC